MRKLLIRCMPLLCVPLFFSSFAVGQTVDTSILGSVTDPQGSVVPGATVVVHADATGQEKTVTTSGDGQYRVQYLVPGMYTVKVEASGFAASTRSGIQLALSQQVHLDVAMSLSGTTQSVDVSAAPQLLQSENATLGTTVDTNRTVNLPLNGRKFNDLAVLTPGVRISNPDNHSSSTAGSTIASNSGRADWGAVQVDGVVMTNTRSAYVNNYPSVDAIEEFRVQTGNFSAEYGFSAGTNINVQLKSGTNQFHGSAFEFIRNDAVDARNYFRPAPLAKNILKQNQFGGTIGGPIFKDKTFFFASYEGLRSIAETPSLSNVLTPAQRNGDFSAYATPLKNPYTGGTYANNQVPVNAVSQSIINTYMPLPNGSFAGGQNYSGASLGRQSNNQYIGRIDHKFNDRNSLFIHYIYTKRDFPITDTNPNFRYTGTYPMHNAALQYIHVFSPSLVNEVRAGVNLEHVKELSVRTGTGFTIESLGINGFKVGGPNGRELTSNEEGFPLLSISGYLGMGDSLAASNLDYSRTFMAADNVTLTKGKHTLLFGVDIRKVAGNATTNNTPFGQQSFTGDMTGYAPADYILGTPRTSITPEGVPITAARQWRTAEYFQDNFRMNDRLTLNLGIRYEIYAPPVDTNNVSRTLDFSQNPPVLTPAPGQRLNNIWSITHKDIAPRVGFAWSMYPTTVVRGGYGITYYGGQFDNINILQLNPPTAGSLTITNPNAGPTAPPLASIETPVPAALYPANPFFNVVTMPADRKRPDAMVQTWNATIEQQFKNMVLTTSYVGTKGSDLDTSIQYFNSPAPGPGDIQSRRPYNTFARIRALDFTGASYYNSLQEHLEWRVNAHSNVTASYVWSHLFDNQGNSTNAGGCTCQDPRNPHEWAPGSNDQRHNFVLAYVYRLPDFTKSRLAGLGMNGWTLNGIVNLASGTPVNVTQSTDSENVDNPWQRPNLVAGANAYVANKSAVNGWYNSSAFALSGYAFGTTPRNYLVGPGTKTVNLSVMKNFVMPYADTHSLQIRFEAFNALNTPQFSSPGSSYGASSFGQISSTNIDNRELQLAVKYLF
ncbi:MAG: carboxypeptidase regulatory-like domain-containing protein [Edaphobacter sp.]|uniref:TonB-dependent receptor n=1 Tax=Edaphobacter sp. TaxID=1934404 RepID=UPI00239B375B|nr:carboxypeptidase regulatory-like domain-containing protein [Edaphobacter sp.]MDE1176694.1 carboxypeptidase regulatory-like domain-containing protein [Edaphobacter sp.]